MEIDQCGPEEDIVRAILHADWDGSRYTSGLFTGPGTSVSRLSILSLPHLIEIFQSDFDKHANGPVLGTGEIKVSELQKIGKEYADPKGKPLPNEITVIPIRTATNIAHAEVPQKLSRGLAFRIIRALNKISITGTPLNPEA